MNLKKLITTRRDGTPEQIAELSQKFAGRQPDDEMAAVLRVLIASDPKPFYELPPKLARRHPPPPTAVETLLTERGERTEPEDVGDVANTSFDGPDGEVKLRVYKPASAAEGQPRNSLAMAWFFEQYLNPAEEGTTPAVSPVDADPSGLPPATVINAELDPLRSEGERLAERLRAAGVDTEQRTFAGVTHEFFAMTPVLAKAREAQAVAAAALRRAFGT